MCRDCWPTDPTINYINIFTNEPKSFQGNMAGVATMRLGHVTGTAGASCL